MNVNETEGSAVVEEKANKLVVSFREKDVCSRLADHILALLNRQSGCKIRPLVVLCIGTDECTGDCLGPLVGSYILENNACITLGTLDHPVHACNMRETVGILEAQYVHPLVIAVDASLGKENEVGNIEVWEGAMEPGAGVRNRQRAVGDISIIGIVNAGGCFGYGDLQRTPLSTVVKLSKIVGKAMLSALGRFSAIEPPVVMGHTTNTPAGCHFARR